MSRVSSFRVVAGGIGAAMVLAMSGFVVSTGPAAAAANAAPADPTVVVIPSDLVSGSPTTGQFVVTNESAGGGSVSIVSGPAGGPSAGSLQMSTTGTSDHWDAFNYDDEGVALSSISTLSYWAYTNNAPDYDPDFQVQADLSPSITFSTVNYEPYEQATPDSANTWQSFNILTGLVWATHIADTSPGGIDDPISWSSFISLYPGATLIGVGADVGSGWPAMTGNVDALSIGTNGASGSTTTYDFSPAPPTTSIIVPSSGATLSGTAATLDAGASNATSVKFLLFGGSYGYAAPVICTATPSYYGWVCSWNTTTVPNGSYGLVSEASGPGGTAYSSGVGITVDNLATQLILPTNGSDISGNVVFDALAQGTNITGVYFVVSVGSASDVDFLTATPTYYGWIGEWNSLACPPGYANTSYSFQSVVTQAGGATAMSAPVDVTLDNTTGGCP